MTDNEVRFSEAQKREVIRLIEESRAREKLTGSQKWEVILILGAISVGVVAVLGLGGAPIVREVARIEASRQATDAYKERLQNDDDFLSFVRGETSTFPRGSILMLDRTDGCPSGWEAAQDISGRFVIGAGSGTGLTSRRFRETGGSELARISIEQMPKHNHKISTSYGANIHDGLAGSGESEGIDQYFGRPSAGAKTDGGHGVLAEVLSFEGGDQPHENMPPFIALQFCKKAS